MIPVANSPFGGHLCVQIKEKTGMSASVPYINGNISVAWEGHTPIGVVGWESTSGYVFPYTTRIVGNNLYYGIGATNGSINNLTFRWYVLYR